MGCYVRGCIGYTSSLVEKEHDIWDEYDHRNHGEKNMGGGESDGHYFRQSSKAIVLSYEEVLARVRKILLERDELDVLILLDLLPDHMPVDKD